MRTQWRTGPGGVLGLDYETALSLMPLLGIGDAERLEALDDLRVMEAGALEVIHKR